jgi:hypothetical protein
MYRKKKKSTKVKDLNSNSFKVINSVKANIASKEKFDEMTLYKLLKLYKNTNKRAVQKAIIDLIFKNTNKIPLSFLVGKSKSYIIHQYIFDYIEDYKEKIKIKDLFTIIKYYREYIEELFSNYNFAEVNNQLKKEFEKKEISVNRLLKIINYYRDASIIDFLLTIYDNYSQCWNRFLIARTVLQLASENDREELLEKFKNDKCGIVQEEVAHFLKRRENL